MERFYVLFVSAKRTKKHAAPTGANFLLVRKFPKGNGFILFASTKRTKSSPEGCDPLDSEGRFKTLQNNFFVIFPPFVPKPGCGATRFFGCFEPVRKGYCTSDARLMFFENGMLYCKLTGASRIRKGQLHVIFIAVGICFGGVLIKYLEVSQGF